MNDQYDQLKRNWYNRLDRILSRQSWIPENNLRCLEMCEARCCPRAGMRGAQAEKIASSVVVLLPFEMEYLMEKTGAARDVFRIWPIDITPWLSINIGMLDLGKPCPFLRADLRCGIHESNPLDCRTFPLLPVQNHRRELEWALADNCPSLQLLHAGFSRHIKKLWQDIYPAIPPSWWDLYNFADHWMGWPVDLNKEAYAPSN